MTSFRGLLEVEGDPESTVITDVYVADGRITLRAAGTEIGDWALNDISIEQGEGAFRILAEGEALLFDVADAQRFSAAVAVSPSLDLADDPAPAISPTSTTGAESGGYAPDAPPDLTPVRREAVAEEPPAPVELIGGDRSEAASRETLRSDETPLARHLSWALAGAAVILFTGAILDWGPIRLTNTDFPIARALVVLSGFAAMAAAYLGLALEKRRDVALVAMLSGLIAILVIVAFTRRADIGYGFVVTILGAVAVISIAILALTRLGTPPRE